MHKRKSNVNRERSVRDHQHVLSRRSLIKWSVLAGATLGLPRWKVFEVLEATGGRALAADAACIPTNRSIHVVGGTGGFAWFQLLWPHNDVAAAADPNFAFHAPGMSTMAQGTDKPLTFAPETPFRNFAGTRQMSAFLCGSVMGHSRNTVTTGDLNGNSIFAVSAALQSTNPSVIPTITVGNTAYGQAPGAPRASQVAAPEDIVGLFDSAASRMGGLLNDPANANLFNAHYASLASLNRAANRSTTKSAYATGQEAASLLGTNMSSELSITPADLTRYGITAQTRTIDANLGKSLIVAVKAFKLGLTSSILISAFNDDPHGAFQNMTSLQGTVTALGTMFDAFMADMAATPDDSCGGTSLADNFVMSLHGDLPKTPLQGPGNWNDGSPGNCNWIYVLGNGLLKTGWHGGVKRDGSITGWDPATGNDATYNGAMLAQSANAAVAYAIAKGDVRRSGDFTRGVEIAGITNPVQM